MAQFEGGRFKGRGKEGKEGGGGVHTGSVGV